jgi:putative ABC transport system substrate-binding protein
MTIDAIAIHGADELEAAFAAMEKDRPDAVIVQSSLERKRPIELAPKYRIPALSIFREFVEKGGLMSYDVVEADVCRR